MINAIFFALLLGSLNTKAQSVGDSYDGMIIEPSRANVPTAYYGEPYTIFLRIENIKNADNYFYVLGLPINSRRILQDELAKREIN